MESVNDTRSQSSRELPAMFRPPVNRAMRTLDRSFFRKTVPLAAAKVFKDKDISVVRAALFKSHDLLTVPRLSNVRQVTDKDGVFRALLLREDMKADDKTTWSPIITELTEKGTAAVTSYEVDLEYDYWSYADIISSILPEDDTLEIPQGFTQVGHVAHLNLREQFYPYKYLIAQILKDKNSSIRTVINKLEDVGSHSEFRTFPFEILAGENDLNVIQHEQDCEFHFDYARVYWNSRLETEHRRLVEKFQAGQMVCDVMAGVGPFAVPAGKRKIFVWANDLNPHGYEVMQDAIPRNRVQDFVTAFNQDGREFIKSSAKDLLQSEPVTVNIFPKTKRRGDSKRKATEPQSSAPAAPPAPPVPSETYTRPTIFDHYVMNLPANAIEFLDAFQGVYAGHESLFAPYTSQALPMVHVYCFSGHSENEVDDHVDICQRVSERIGYTITPEDRAGGSGNSAIELAIHNVRLVSPNKQMFCASFRLPGEVAFRKV
ncbi:tRNA(m(1)G37)methyltransferase [Penicillium angulare]|uniref:tRNA(m(1)G37)methyltransferase n=1 Tax=Penicillium angulare TaxID=116970 RepID=UPI00254017DA|nr:tRNA(m(1)G37)methyltransferase [Penicillium angulare]KAJ5288746.1 tRNA(m(1)G37)methyltransferase [Penicillium angulare]